VVRGRRETICCKAGALVFCAVRAVGACSARVEKHARCWSGYPPEQHTPSQRAQQGFQRRALVGSPV